VKYTFFFLSSYNLSPFFLIISLECSEAFTWLQKKQEIYHIKQTLIKNINCFDTKIAVKIVTTPSLIR
jgi:hypothetical protein